MRSGNSNRDLVAAAIVIAKNTHSSELNMFFFDVVDATEIGGGCKSGSVIFRSRSPVFIFLTWND